MRSGAAISPVAQRLGIRLGPNALLQSSGSMPIPEYNWLPLLLEDEMQCHGSAKHGPGTQARGRDTWEVALAAKRNRRRYHYF